MEKHKHGNKRERAKDQVKTKEHSRLLEWKKKSLFPQMLRICPIDMSTTRDVDMGLYQLQNATNASDRDFQIHNFASKPADGC